MEVPDVRRLTSARIPTSVGEFTLVLYENSEDDKDHLALIFGNVSDASNTLVRIHSECFTGDVLGSLRCDCGEQLHTSMERLAEEGQGVILYLRQEGRGIGLLNKLKAYNLQDEGYDTVEANRMLGHGADERDYTIGARILEDLGIRSVRLLTNNPEKIESLQAHGIEVSERVPLEPHVTPHNADYLRTKVDRMRHILELGPGNGRSPGHVRSDSFDGLRQRSRRFYEATDRPFVTLTYAQSLDGSIATEDGRPLAISGEGTLGLTHRLRARHDAILVGIGTVLADDPRLTVRRTSGEHPIPVVLDSALRFPLDATLLSRDGPAPIIFTTEDADPQRRTALEEKGVTVIEVPSAGETVRLEAVLDVLGDREISSLMVEGGSTVITSFLRCQLVQRVIVTVAPVFVGGTSALDGPARTGAKPNAECSYFPQLENLEYRWIDDDLVLEGDPVWPETD